MNSPLPPRFRAGLWLTALCWLAAMPAAAGPFSGIERIFKDWGFFQGLQINGSNDFTFQQNLVEGSSSAFQGQRWDTDPFMRRSSLSLEGPIWKEFSFKADFSSSGYGPSYNRWVVGYIGNDTGLYYGDLNIDLSGNQFASFSKPVRGWQLDQKIGDGLARVFYSEEKAITRFQNIPGNNTSGPFFLTYTPVMQGSEAVKVNERRMEFGVDYRLDYDTGQLWFEVEGRPPTIIPDTSTITISYQSAGYDSRGGTLYGGRFLMPLMKERLQVGLTMLQQDRDSGSVRDTVGYQEDIFNGSGSTGPFDVNFRPIIPNGTNAVYDGKEQTIQQALLVLVDNVEQAEGVDYDAYRQIGRIIFRRSVPPTALVAIRYYYDLSSTLPVTNNRLLGVDLLYHITPELSLQAEWGSSDGGLDTNTGDAMRLNLDYTTPKFKVVGEYRDISPTFSFLDSVGFYRQDKGYELGLNWQPLDHVSVSARRSDLKTSDGYSFGYSGYGSYGGGSYYPARLVNGHMIPAGLSPLQETTSPSLDIGSQRNDFEVRLDFPGWPTFAYQRQEMSNSGSTNNSDYTGNNFTMNWSPSKLPFSLSGSYNLTDQNFLPLADSAEATGSSTEQLQWSASYRPSDKLSVSLNQSRNKSISIGSDSRSSSSSDQVAVHWAPFRQMDINYDITRTNSVGSVSSGFYNTPNYGYSSPYAAYLAGISDGGGIGGGDEDDEENRYTDNSQRLGITYRPTDKLSLDFNMMSRKYSSAGTVGYLADSNQTTRGLNVSYMLSDALSLNAAYTSDRMTFLDENQGSVINNTLGVGANYRPSGTPWSFGLNYNMISGSSPTYSGFGANQRMYIVDNNMSDLTANVTYDLGNNSQLGLTAQLSDYAGGYANFNRQQMEIGYRRKLNDFADLTFGYRFARNLSKGLTDPRYGNTSLTPQDQNYLANTFLLTVSTQFNTGVGGGGTGISGFGGSNLSGFGGYRAGTSLWQNSNNMYQGGNFNNLGVYGNNPMGSGYSSPFGSSGGYNNYNNANPYGSNRPQGYEVFGSGFAGQEGFSQGLGDIAGQRKPGLDGLNTPGAGAPPPPGSPEALWLEAEHWQELDDLYSIWW